MNLPHSDELISIVQMSSGPAILISGAGLWQLTLVNRLNHILDRIRTLAAQPDLRTEDMDKAFKARQLRILWARLHWIRAAATLVALSALSSAGLIVAIFVATFLRLEASGVIGFFFTLAILSLMLSFLLLMVDIQQSLSALKLELNRLV